MSSGKAFICLTLLFFYINSCSSCNGPAPRKRPPKPEAQRVSLRNLFVEGKLDGNVTQTKADIASNKIYFKEGQRLLYTCFQNFSAADGITFYWVQKKGGGEVFFGKQSSDPWCQIQMTLYKFDNDSTLSCFAHGRNFNTSMDIPLYLIETPSKAQYSTTNELVTEGNLFEMKCKADDYIQAAPANNSMIITNQLGGFNVTTDHNGLMIFCVCLEVTVIEGGSISKRKISNIKVLKLNNDELDIAAVPQRFPIHLVLIAIGGMVALFVAVLFIFCCVHKNWNPIEEPPQLVEDLHSEPVYAAADQVVYAQLQLSHNSSRNKNLNNSKKKNKKLVETSEEPYVEIIGVMAPFGDRN